MAKTRTIKQRLFIEAPPDKVFRALIEPRLLNRWFLKSARLTPRKGGNYEFTWHGGYSHSGKVLEFSRGQKLSLQWPGFSKGKFLGNTRSTFKLRPKDKGTILDLSHSGFRKSNIWVETYGGACSGWAYFLTNLKSVLRYGRDLRSPQDSI